MKNMILILALSASVALFSCSQESYLVQQGTCNYCDKVFHGDSLIFSGYVWREDGYKYHNPPTKWTVLAEDTSGHAFVAAKNGSWSRSFEGVSHCDFIAGYNWEFLPVIEVTFDDSLRTTLLVDPHTGKDLVWGYGGFLHNDSRLMTWMYHYEGQNLVKEWVWFKYPSFQTEFVSKYQVDNEEDGFYYSNCEGVVLDCFGNLIFDHKDCTWPKMGSHTAIGEDGKIWSFIDSTIVVDSFQINFENLHLDWWIESSDHLWLLINLDEYGWSMRNQRWLVNLPKGRAKLLQDWDGWQQEAAWAPSDNEKGEWDALIFGQDTLSLNRVWYMLK